MFEQGISLWEAADKSWMDDNPDQRFYVRKSYDGEFDVGQIDTQTQFCVRYGGYEEKDIFGIGSHTIVVRIPAARLRLPYWHDEITGDDEERYPVEAELAEGGKITSLREFCERFDTRQAIVEEEMTQQYLSEVLPAFLVSGFGYDGNRGPSKEAMVIMAKCCTLTTDAGPFEGYFDVREADKKDHEGHSDLHEQYEPDDFPAVLAVQPYPGFFVRFPFPHFPMKESDRYRFLVSAACGEGTLEDYLEQVRESLRFAIQKMGREKKAVL